MITREQALSNLDHADVAARLEARRLYDAAVAASDAYGEALRLKGVDEDEDDGSDPELAALSATLENADNAFEGFDLFPTSPLTTEDDEGNISLRLCALTGLMIGEGDPMLEDAETGEIILKKSLGWPLNEDGSFAPAEAA